MTSVVHLYFQNRKILRLFVFIYMHLSLFTSMFLLQIVTKMRDICSKTSIVRLPLGQKIIGLDSWGVPFVEVKYVVTLDNQSVNMWS